MREFSSRFNHVEAEARWRNFWEENLIYKWDENISREDSYVIDTPPPTVSGLLHMGHIFSYTQADIIARYQRMKGKNVFYPIGFDDNGLPTERLVEKVKNVRAVNMSRLEFTELCKDVVRDSEEEFREVFKTIALSVDWSQEYQTISDNSKTISQMSFLDLYQKGYIYRKEEPVLWDPIDRTALSQADIEDIEHDSFMNNIRFTLEDKDLIIATTRPELLPACVAIFVHPEDERYKNIIGKKAISPIFGAEVQIFADDNVSMEKGTGVVMCCTFGDNTDVIWWKKFSLPTKMIINKAGKIVEKENLSFFDNFSEEGKMIYEKMIGMKIKEARQFILGELEKLDLLVSKEAIMHSVKCAERSKSPIEILITPQWFVKVLDIKEDLLKKANLCNWHPAYMKERLESWINGLSWDWCISRQRFFGVPIPVWYSKRCGEEGKVLFPDVSDLPVDPMQHLPRGYSADEVEPDCDILDTWATSSVSPQLSSRGINENYMLDAKRHANLFPADLRPQAHEIIRTWAFTTIVKSHLHQDSVPWHNLMISGWCLAADKSKMSKSKGNVVTPSTLIKSKGADVIRYWTATSKLGADIAYSDDTLSNGDRLINKLWNAAKYVQIHLQNKKEKIANLSEAIAKREIFEVMDLWLLKKLEMTLQKVTLSLDKYEYASARHLIEQFFWKDFCDNYLEISKARAYNADGSNAAGQQSAIQTMYFVLKNILIMLAPIMPFITEEIYHIIFVNTEKSSIHEKNIWPNFDLGIKDVIAEVGEEFVAILDVVRQFKAEKKVSIKAPLAYLQIDEKQIDKDVFAQIAEDLKLVTNANLVMLNQNLEDDFITTITDKTAVKLSLVC